MADNRRRTRACIVCALAAFVLVVSHAVHIQAQAAPLPAVTTVWSGVYTDAQAERGSVVYLRTCSKCHGSDLLGNEAVEYPALVGDDFMHQWEGSPLSRLVDRIRTGMPFDRPGTLSPHESVDLVAYLLRTNRVPEGASELPPDRDALQRVVLTRSETGQ